MDKLYEKAYKNLMLKVENKDPSALKLYNEFNQFKIEQNDWLEKNAVFVQLKNLLGMDDNFFEWPDMCRNFFDYMEDKDSPFHDEAIEYYDKLNKRYGLVIE